MNYVYLMLCIIIILLVLNITAVPYVRQLQVESEADKVTNLLNSGHNALGRIVVDAMHRMSTDKGLEHGVIDEKLDKILEILNDTK